MHRMHRMHRLKQGLKTEGQTGPSVFLEDLNLFPLSLVEAGDLIQQLVGIFLPEEAHGVADDG